MNNERYNQILSVLYYNFLGFLFDNQMSVDPPWDEASFIKACKTDYEFLEFWGNHLGLKIEKRELTWKERSNLQTEDQRKGRVPDKNGIMQGEFGNLSPFTEKMIHYWCNQFNIPTKLITITYNNETIEVYE